MQSRVKRKRPSLDVAISFILAASIGMPSILLLVLPSKILRLKKSICDCQRHNKRFFDTQKACQNKDLIRYNFCYCIYYTII